jgi:tRNA nucleotidyltransferase/poly(A) polymerase
LLWNNGKDITKEPYIERYNKLKSCIGESSLIKVPKNYSWSELDEAMKNAEKEGSEGIVIKTKDGKYNYSQKDSNEKTGEWFKYKIEGKKAQTDEVILNKYEKAKEKLVFPAYQYKDGTLFEVGKLSGLPKEEEQELKSKIDDGKVVVVEVSFQERMESGKFRHMGWSRQRPDKPEKSVKISNRRFFFKKKSNKDISINENERKVFDFVKDAIKYFNLNVTARVAGGWVRDKIMGKSSKDIDIAVDKMSGKDFSKYLMKYADIIGEDAKSGLIPAKPDQGKNLETAIFRIMGEDIEIVNLRDEKYIPGSRHPETIPTDSPIKDAFRRDFTINCLFYNINTGKVEDFTGTGISDVENGIIRTPEVSAENINEVGRHITAKQTFMDDPLRIMRAIRFANRYGFRIDESVANAARDEDVQREFRKMITPERIEIEMRKIMGENRSPRYALELIRDWGLRDEVLRLPEEYSEWEMDQNNPHHELNLWDHLMEALDNIQEIVSEKNVSAADRYILNWATLLHDVGKLDPNTHGIKDLEGKLISTYYGHENSSMKAAEYMLRKLPGTSVKEIERIKTLIDAARRMNPSHLDPDQPSSMGSKAIGKILRLTKDFEYDWERALEVAMADSAAHKKDWIRSNQYPRTYWDSLSDQFKSMPKNVGTMPPLLSGKDIMEMFGRKGGPWVGKIISAMIDWQLENLNATKEDAVEFAKKFYESNGLDKTSFISFRHISVGN